MKLRKKFFYLIIVIAIFLRLFVTFFSGGFIHSDEIFQTLEQGHKLTFGYGLVPWEFKILHQRSFFYPYIISFLFRLFLFLNYDTILFSIRLIHSLFSIFIVIGIYYIGKELYDEKVGLIVAFLSSIWWENIFYSSRTLNSSFSANFLIPSLALFIIGTKKNYRYLFFSGILLGIGFMINFTIAIFLIPIFLTLMYYNNIKKILLYFLSGFLLICLFQGLIDLFTYDSFFISPINFFKQDVIEQVSIQFGVEPFYYYFTSILKNWSFLSILFVPLFIIGLKNIRKTSYLIIDSIFLPLIILSLIPHKEYRFIFLFLPLFLLVIANGIFNMISYFSKSKNLILFIILSLVVITSIYMLFKVDWSPKKDLCSAMRYVGNKNDSTGVIVLDTWSESCGYVYLHKNIPILFFPAQNEPYIQIPEIDTPDDLKIKLGNNTFNYVIFTKEKSSTIKEYENYHKVNFTSLVLDLLKNSDFIEDHNLDKSMVFKRI